MIEPFAAARDVKPYYPCVVDIETEPDGSVIAIGFAYEHKGERRYRVFSGWSEWWEFAQTLPQKDAKFRTFYAHNGLGFDWLSFIRWSESVEEIKNIRYIFNGGFGIGCTFYFNDRCYHLRDSIRLLPGTLESVCKAFDTDFKKQDLGGKLPHEILESDPERFYEYLQADCMGLQSAIFSFWSIIYNEVGSIDRLPLTLPSLAMKLFRMTLTEPIMTPRNEHLKALERRAYTGGRTECYFAGVADVSVFDVNSEYPYVMREGFVPVSYIGGYTNEYNGNHGIYHVTYTQTNRDYLPVLRDEQSNEFRYSGEGVYTQPEIELLLFVGGKIDVLEGYVYESTGNVFRPFVERWWNLRKNAIAEGNTGLAYVAKIMMNSLYGKFGQKETGTVLVEASPDTINEFIAKDRTYYDHGDYLIVEEDVHSEYTFVGIAAYITAMARVHLYMAIMDAQAKGGRIWAVDTDSVHVEGVDLDTDPTTLGALKLEYHGETAYLGKKMYSQKDGKIKAKGIGKPEKHGITHAVMVNIATGKQASARVEFPCAPTFREVLIAGKEPCRFFPRERTISATAPRKEPP